MHTLAWNNDYWTRVQSLVYGLRVTTNGGDRGHSYCSARGEILGFLQDEQLRKRLPRALSSIKNESWGLEDD
jgi:hypothetical protein